VAPANVTVPAPAAPKRWRTAEELVAIGFERSRVVMMNEAHHMLLRSVRTREMGRRILPAAHDAGVRHLAMEALFPQFATAANETRALPEVGGGYLSQPEMRMLIEEALALGWTLIPYEVDTWPPPELDPGTREAANWRDEQQARNLVAALEALPSAAPLLVWCGNGHLTKCAVPEWRPMGFCFAHLSGIEPFAVDQTRSVEFPGRVPDAAPWVAAYADVLARPGGAAGFLAEDAPDGWFATETADAFVIAADNRMS
jgi:hypothetical protein